MQFYTQTESQYENMKIWVGIIYIQQLTAGPCTVSGSGRIVVIQLIIINKNYPICNLLVFNQRLARINHESLYQQILETLPIQLWTVRPQIVLPMLQSSKSLIDNPVLVTDSMLDGGCTLGLRISSVGVFRSQ